MSSNIPAPSPYLPSNYYQNGQLVVSSATAQQVGTLVQQDASQLPSADQNTFLLLVQDSTTLLTPGANGQPPADLAQRLQVLEGTAEVISFFSQGECSDINALTQALDREAYFEEQANQLAALADTQEEIAQADDAAGEDRQGATELQNDAIASLTLNLCASVIQVAAGAGVLKELGGEVASDGTVSEGLDKLADKGRGLVEDIKQAFSKATEYIKNALKDGDDNCDNVSDSGSSDGGDHVEDHVVHDLDSGSKNDGDNPDEVREIDTRTPEERAAERKAKQELANAIAGLFSSTGKYMETQGQANNQFAQASVQLSSAQQNYYKELQNNQEGFLNQAQSFIQQIISLYGEILQAEANMGSAIAQAAAKV
jgi:hypothetical protein